jgi:hypothetical protein
MDEQGRKLLALLVSRLPNVVPDNPRTFIGYKEAHTALGLSQMADKWGESLKRQGLSSLADWTASQGKPAITGIVIDTATLMPGNGYFSLFGRTRDDYQWWVDQVRLSKQYDWSPFLPPPDSPKASDIAPPERQECTTYRILRDTALARRVKQLHQYECQVCKHSITLPNGLKYAEAHHVQPLGHNGPDVMGNILCLCPNHHAELDYGVSSLSLKMLRIVAGHVVDEKYIQYHNDKIFGKT